MFGRIHPHGDWRSGVFAEQLSDLPLSSQKPERIVNGGPKPDCGIRAAHPRLEAMPGGCNRHSHIRPRFAFGFFASRRCMAVVGIVMGAPP